VSSTVGGAVDKVLHVHPIPNIFCTSIFGGVLLPLHARSPWFSI
jgi:hypothetical protein